MKKFYLLVILAFVLSFSFMYAQTYNANSENSSLTWSDEKLPENTMVPKA